MDANRIIEILSDGNFHSGESLGQQMGVSRTAIWKQINQLERVGLQVYSVKGKGYRMPKPVELLTQKRIRLGMDAQSNSLFAAIDIKSEVTSTNDEVRAMECESSPYVCLAEMQSAGRGRRGRSWVSPYGSNIYMSLAWMFPDMAGSLDGLSLCVGIAVARAIKKLGIDGVGLKWPNDLVYQQQKVAGILLELEGELSGPMKVVIGIGVNVSMSELEGAQIDQGWTSLSNIANLELSRNKLVSKMLMELAEILPLFQENGFAGFVQQWHDLDQLFGRDVLLQMPNRQVQGLARGVNDAGELLIEDDSGITSYRAGEVSVRVTQ